MQKPLPDIQEKCEFLKTIHPVAISQVGIRNLCMPFTVKVDQELMVLEGNVEIACNLESHRRGVHMSRFVRTLYEQGHDVLSWGWVEKILKICKKQMESPSCNLAITLRYPLLQTSLRSGLKGYQYYPITWVGRLDEQDILKKSFRFEIEYASTCPCSAALAQHAMEERKVYSTPHAQRSKAFVCVDIKQESLFTPENLQFICAKALQTQTQVLVKREDEQAFAELNGQHLKFVEDALRLLHHALSKEEALEHFAIECVHYESLHSFDVFAKSNA